MECIVQLKMVPRPDGGVKKILTKIHVPIRQKPIYFYYMIMMCASINFFQQYNMNLLCKNDVKKAFLLLLNVETEY